jgi:hypothetical protein
VSIYNVTGSLLIVDAPEQAYRGGGGIFGAVRTASALAVDHEWLLILAVPRGHYGRSTAGLAGPSMVYIITTMRLAVHCHCRYTLLTSIG